MDPTERDEIFLIAFFTILTILLIVARACEWHV